MPGGDFDPIQRASQPVDQPASYVFSGPGMIDDVQSWLDQPAGDHGWLLKTDELAVQTTKRFDSAENPAPQLHPQLTVEFTPATAVPGSSIGSETALVLVLLAMLAAGTLLKRR